MQLFVSGLLEQCRRHELNAELIVVEWNPPGDRPSLAEGLYWPDTGGYCKVRIIHVPPEIHRRFKFSDALPVFQMIGKNVGIRRAQGEFVLATNVDVLFSRELFEFFSSAQLKRGKVYRIDRFDACEDISSDMSLDEQLEYCENHLIRVNCRNGTFDVSLTGEILFDETAARGFRHYLRAMSEPRELLLLPKQVLRSFVRWIFALVKDPYKLHTNASGDFTLMSKDDWFTLRGYCEYEMYSMHLDSLLCYAAGAFGIQEVILRDPMRVYHIEHSLGSGWQPGKGGDLLYQRLREAGIPAWTNRQLILRVVWMWLRRNPLLYNNREQWGLANESFQETIVGASEKESTTGSQPEPHLTPSSSVQSGR